MNSKSAVTAQPHAGSRLSAAQPHSRRKMRWWMPAFILVVAAGAIAYLRLSGMIEDNGFENFFTLLIGLGALALLTLWYLFFTGLTWGQFFVRALAVGGLVALFHFGVMKEKVLRFEGSTGNMIMRFSWAWSPRVGDDLPELKPTTAVLSDVASSPDDFPQFLGPTRQAVVEGARLARDWSTPPREVWRQAVGLGWGSFAIQGPLAITQEQRGDKEWTVCRDKMTGEVRWTHENTERFSEKLGGDGPRATPTIADGRVYVLGATGVLDCLELKTGALIWTAHTLTENGASNLIWGKSSSPLVVDDVIVISLGEEEDGSLVAYNTNTGKLKWKAVNDKATYCSPMVATLAGKRQIVSVNAKTVTGHEIADGKELWNFPWPNEMAKASQPVPLPGDRLLLTSGYGDAGCPSALVLEFSLNEGKLQYKQVWGQAKLKTKFTTAVVRDGFAYALDDGVLTCIDLANGERKWKAGRYGHGQVLRVDDLLIVQAEDPGDLILIEANPARHAQLGRIKTFADKTWNNPALSGRHLFVRNDREAVCYELPAAGEK